MNDIELTSDQIKARDSVISFANSHKNLLTIGGLAGTGKTTTISKAIHVLRAKKKFKKYRVAFVCFTGKASIVLKDKLINADALKDEDYCGTIHSLIYRPELDEEGNIKQWSLVPCIEYDLIVIDEASMVGDRIFEDLKSYRVPIIAVGDHGQLPPVFSKFNLMENPEVKLEIIHRQAQNSPIIKLSMMARSGADIPFGDYSNDKERVFKIQKSQVTFFSGLQNRQQLENTMILCGMNGTRIGLNRKIRAKIGMNGSVCKDDIVICLKNNRKQGIFNGMIGCVLDIKDNGEDFYKVKIKFDYGDFEWKGKIFKHQFGRERTLHTWRDWKRGGRIMYDSLTIGNLFDFGYVITTHKAQGSQAENVILIEERINGFSEDMYNRWRYTGITRSQKNLTIVG